MPEHSYKMTRAHRYVNVVVHSLDGAPVAIFEDVRLSKAVKILNEIVANGIGEYAAHEVVSIIGAMKPKTEDDV